MQDQLNKSFKGSASSLDVNQLYRQVGVPLKSTRDRLRHCLQQGQGMLHRRLAREWSRCRTCLSVSLTVRRYRISLRIPVVRRLSATIAPCVASARMPQVRCRLLVSLRFGFIATLGRHNVQRGGGRALYARGAERFEPDALFSDVQFTQTLVQVVHE